MTIPFPTIETKRLLLRELVPTDADALYAIHSDIEGMRWYGADTMTEPSQATKLIELFASWRRLANPGTRWGIERREDARLIGTCGLFSWNANSRSCALGFELARDAWGGRYMAETLNAVLSHGWETMQLNRIGAQVHPSNTLSLRLLIGLGFQFEGRLRQIARWNGVQHDLMQLSLLRDEAPDLAESRR